MDPGIIAVSIPIVGIVFGVGAGIIKSILRSQERRLEIRMQAQQGQNEAVTQQLAAMRAEIVALRDTTTQFDLTRDYQMQRMEQRLSRLETRAVAQTVTPDEPLQSLRPG